MESEAGAVFASPGFVALPPRECHLWLADTATIRSELVGDYEALLCEREKARVGELRAADRSEYLVTRALVRTALSRYCGVAPHEWRFAPNRFGRPEVVYPAKAPPLAFNLSHTSGLVACALAWSREIGVDVERVRKRAVVEIAEGFLAEPERDQLLRLSGPHRTERFFALWTLKESYIKARGLGFAIPPDAYHFQLDCSPLVFRAPPGDCAESWQFEQLRPSPNHRLALALRADNGPLEIVTRSTVPLWD